MRMESISLFHVGIVLFYIFIIVFPVARILRRLGMSGWWAVLAVIPLVNLVSLWILAFVGWPRDRESWQ